MLRELFLYIGVSFDTSTVDLIEQIPVAMKVFANGVEAFVNDPTQVNYINSKTTLGCFFVDEGNSLLSLIH